MKPDHPAKSARPDPLLYRHRFRLFGAALVAVLTVSVGYLTYTASRASSYFVSVTGHVSFLGTNRSGVVIYTCRDGTSDLTTSTNSSGNFSFLAGGDGGTDNQDQGYCVRVQSVPGVNIANGFHVLADNNNPEVKGGASYEAQLANFNCYHNAYCAGRSWYNWDRSSDSGFNFTITDTQNPSATINAPAAGAHVAGTVTLGAGASDNAGVTGVVFFVDGVNVGTDASYPYAIAWNSASRANGQHTLLAQAYDTSGNRGNSAAVTITVDNSHPAPPPSPPPHPTPSPRPTGSGTTSGNPADTAAPTAPTDFQAGLDGDVIDLTWTAATDNIGVAHYELERSLDQATWDSVDNNITDVTFKDTTGGFNTHYYYRLKAVDAAGNASPYALADVSTGSFNSNTSAGSSTTVKSDDGLVVATITAGAVASDAQCSFINDTSNQDQLKPPKLILIAGPYSLVCKQSDGTNIDSFKKRVGVAVTLTTQQQKQFGGLKFYQYDSGASAWKLFKVTVDKKTKANQFAVDKPIQFAVMGSIKKGISAQFVVIVILIILAIAAAVFFILRRAKKQQYDQYIRKKYYNL